MNFISETDIEEAKKKRAEEWEKAREQGRELRMSNFLVIAISFKTTTIKTIKRLQSLSIFLFHFLNFILS